MWNEAKLRTFKFFKAHPSATATDLVGAFLMPVSTAQMEVFQLYEEKREKERNFQMPNGRAVHKFFYQHVYN